MSLSKSKLTTGLQCHLWLWLSVHEHDAPELQVDDPVRQAVFDHGSYVGDVARSYIPGGALIDLPHRHLSARVEATRAALAAGNTVVYEAAFMTDRVFVAVDILHRSRRGWTLTEVKSSTRAKAEHIADAAVQTHVVRGAGLDVSRVEIMHLNRACRYPELDQLFTRTDVTAEVEAVLPSIPLEARRQLRLLERPQPSVEVGSHCTTPYPCPFVARCWAPTPAHHVNSLYRISAKRLSTFAADGHSSIYDLPATVELSAVADRQRRAVQSDELIVEPGLGRALAALEGPIAYLDFETIALPIPVWAGCAPYDAVPVQLSCHVDDGAGGLDHHEWLADGPGDPREGLARALIRAVRGAKTILTYNASFELARIRELAAALPKLAPALKRIERRVRDLLPIVRDHVYHPDFGGSFGLKSVLPALVPELRHSDLAIQDGGVASVELERLLFGGGEMPRVERAQLRGALLAYCGLDTLAMVKIVERLRLLADE